MLAAKHSFAAIGTQWSIETETPLIAAEHQSLHRIIDDFSRSYSRFSPSSLVWQARDAKKAVTFPASIGDLLAWYQLLYTATKGAVNPLVGDSLEQLGYGPHLFTAAAWGRPPSTSALYHAT